jgi:hypothetical protein
MNTQSNSLLKYFKKNDKNAINKWMHYFDIYDKHFKKYHNSPVTILEIGVFQGGSLNMWRDYFGDNAQIYAIDINNECKQFETRGTKIFIGSQEDREFLNDVKTQIPKVDILIDDGGHNMNQQIVSFEELYDHVKDDGIYLVEDLHTSYWHAYGGGYKKHNSFIEYSKNFIDILHAWHSEDPKLTVTPITKSMYALHFYDSLLVIEKKGIKPPESKMIGKVIIDIDKFSSGPVLENSNNKLCRIFGKFLNKILC